MQKTSEPEESMKTDTEVSQEI